jgi:GH15 family glucan-1,4-alpha-glucosidase
MARALTLGNGSLLVGIDARGSVRDLYYPYVGLENNISSGGGTFQHRIGVWVEGKLSWLCDAPWSVHIEPSHTELSGSIHAENPEIGISLTIKDVVLSDRDAFVREVSVRSVLDEPRDVRIFFAQQFRISEDRSGSTGFFDPRVDAVVHYKGPVFLLVSGMQQKRIPLDDYSVGLFNMEAREGTHIDAEDGELSKNPIEHGSVDSVIRFSMTVSKQSSGKVTYWIVAGTSIDEVHEQHLSLSSSMKRIRKTTRDHWKRWLSTSRINELGMFSEGLRKMYTQSLLVTHAHFDKGGGSIASSDSDILNYGRDTYAYVWPRDSAYAAYALDVAGYHDAAQKCIQFMGSCLERDGYLMHKYRPDGSLGSSWHPWIWHGKPELPIQEDETATVLFMMHKHYELTRDDQFVASLYDDVIVPMSEFLCRHIDERTGLPLESYDLWEETYGTSPYTASSVYGGLMAAAAFAKMRRAYTTASRYRKTAERVKSALLTHLYDAERGIFLKYVRPSSTAFDRNLTLDISALHGLWFFGVLPPDAPELARMHEAVEHNLLVQSSLGGYMRYQEDNYYRLSRNDPPNPWIVTTLWVARYRIQKARSLSELESARMLIEWAYERGTSTHMLSEQYNPHTGTPLSVMPLVWSHAELIMAMHEYERVYNALHV